MDEQANQEPELGSEFKANSNLVNRILAMNAHTETSFSPEKRGDTVIASFAGEVDEVYEILKPYAKTDKQKEELKQNMESFQIKYADKYNDLLARRGRILSTMITGPANFPVRRNEKANNAYENKWNKNKEFKNRFIVRVRKYFLKESISDAGGEYVILENKIKVAEKVHAQMKAMNKIVRKKITDEEKLKEMVDAGVSEHMAREILKPNYMWKPGFEGWELSNSNANIKRMKSRLIKLDKRE